MRLNLFSSAAALLLAALPGLAAAQNLQELYDAARTFDATVQAARATFQSAEYRVAQVEALGRPSVNANMIASTSQTDPPNSDRKSNSNLTGTLHVLEGCRHNGIEHLVFASTSSVYGANTKMPFSVHQNADHPLSFYAATKKANELMAHTYASLYDLPVTGLRFFTVYGPWGRPDMALFLFARNILAGQPIDVFNYGKHRRDFTYVDDIASGVVAALDRVAAPDSRWDSDNPDPATSRAPYRIYNIGNNRPVELMRYIEVLEDCLGRKAEKNLLPLQIGDVPDTWADAEDLVREVGYRPSTSIEEGVAKFVAWYLDYYRDGGPANPRVTNLG